MDIRLLGSFEVDDRGRPQTPTSAKHRQVLSLLAVNVNAVVGVDQLVDEIWGERPPISATTTLQTYIYHLRKMYDLDRRSRCEGDTVLKTVPNGYQLELEESAVDSARFARCWSGELSHHGRHDPATRYASLEAALGLWRGRAFDGVSVGPSLQAAAVWLDEQRRAMDLMRIDVAFDLGRHHELTAELRRATTHHPTDESLQVRLMLALHRSGRRFEALEVYREARQAIVDELGVDPHPSLQQMHERILRGDPELDHVAPEGAVAVTIPADVPCMVPAPVQHFVGHAYELCSLLDRVTGPDVQAGATHTYVVTGPPGIGKTSFCLQVGHALWDEYDGGRFYADLATSDPAEALAAFLQAAGFPAVRVPRSTAERAMMFQSWCSSHRALVILDHVTDFDEISALIPTRPGCLTIIAAQRRVFAPTVDACLQLSPLRTEDATQYLIQAAGDRADAEREQLAELVRHCCGIPAALAEVADDLSRHHHWSLRRVLDELHQRHDAGPHVESQLNASIDKACAPLNDDLLSILDALADDPDPQTAGQLGAGLGVSANEAEVRAEELVQRELVEVGTGPHGFTYGVNDLFRRRFDPQRRTSAVA